MPPSTQPHYFGWKKQNPDRRDRFFAYHPSPHIIATLPPAVDLLANLGPVFDQGALGSCFPAGTLIRMADGTERRIEDIRCLDRVLTAEGNVGAVYRTTVRHEKESILRLQIWGHNHLRLTAEHPVLTRRGYVPAGELVNGDWIAMPRYLPCTNKLIATDAYIAGRQNVRQTIKYRGVIGRKGLSVIANPVPDMIQLTPGVGRIFGLFLSEGSTSASKVVWTFGRHEEDTLVPELLHLLKVEFGVEGYIQQRSGAAGSTNVVLYGTAWAKLFEGLCSTGAGAKKLHPEMAAGPRDFLEALLRGWLDGDGTIEESNRQKGTTVSHELAMSMFDLAQSLGMWPTLQLSHPKISHGVKTRRPRWDIRFQVGRTEDDYHAEQMPKHVWRKFRRKDIESFSGPVFNLSVEGDESYVAEGIGVHNCGPNSSDGDIMNQQHNQGLSIVPQSRLFIYYNTRVIMGTVGQDSGVDNRSMMKALAQYGSCPESMWPYNVNQFTTKPPQAAYDAAAQNKISGYASVAQNLDTMRAALASGDTFIVGFTVYQSFESQAVAATGIVPMPGPSEQVVGGHDILFCGYNDAEQMFDFRNSWGPGWGNRGNGKMPYSYATDPNLSGDFWTVTQIPGGVTPPTPTPPGPTPVPNDRIRFTRVIPAGSWPVSVRGAQIGTLTMTAPRQPGVYPIAGAMSGEADPFADDPFVTTTDSYDLHTLTASAPTAGASWWQYVQWIEGLVKQNVPKELLVMAINALQISPILKNMLLILVEQLYAQRIVT